MNKTKKKFDSVKMSLDIKEALYNENKELSLSEYLEKISKEVQNASFWQEKNTDIAGKRKVYLKSKKKGVIKDSNNSRKQRKKRKELA
jgi:hypothetical protein